MKIWGANGSTEWDADAEFKQGEADVWYAWPGSAPENTYELMAVGSIGDSIGLKWLAGYNMQVHTITGATWHTAANETGILKNTAGTMTWADTSHSHTYTDSSPGTNHTHVIFTHAGHDDHSITEESTHWHSVERKEVQTTEVSGHTHTVHVIVASGGEYFPHTSEENAHDHDGYLESGGSHDHGSPTGGTGYHAHTQT